MRQFLAFIAIGSFFATVEEFLTVVVLRHDVASYLFTLVVLFPVFLTFVWASSRLLNRLARRQPTRELLHFFLYGLVGLLLEWFLIGLTPWSDPNAHPAAMLLFQLGIVRGVGDRLDAPVMPEVVAGLPARGQVPDPEWRGAWPRAAPAQRTRVAQGSLTSRPGRVCSLPATPGPPPARRPT